MSEPEQTEPVWIPTCMSDDMHPTGRCQCSGEGLCSWCLMDEWREKATEARSERDAAIARAEKAEGVSATLAEYGNQKRDQCERFEAERDEWRMKTAAAASDLNRAMDLVTEREAERDAAKARMWEAGHAEDALCTSLSTLEARWRKKAAPMPPIARQSVDDLLDELSALLKGAGERTETR